MVSLRLESATTSVDLAQQETTGYGVQAIAGLVGFGLPPVDAQWFEGAGDGAQYRGRRVLPRSIDLPLSVRAINRAGLKDSLSEIAKVLSGEATLVFNEDRSEDWTTKVVRVGGGDWVYGSDTNGTTELRTVITLLAGDPFFTSTRQQRREIGRPPVGLLTGSLSELHTSSAQTTGSIILDNDGDAVAYPTWTIIGPCTQFRAVSPTDDVLEWNGTLGAGDTLTIDTRPGHATVLDDDGANRYGNLAPRPMFWPIPEGTSTCAASLDGSSADSRITCSWRARRWVVI